MDKSYLLELPGSELTSWPTMRLGEALLLFQWHGSTVSHSVVPTAPS